MSRDDLSTYERRKAELAGRVVLRALELMPSGQVSGILLAILDAGIHGPADRALFGFSPQASPGGSSSSGGASGAPAAIAALTTRH